MGRCPRSGRSPDGREDRSAMGRTRRSRRGTLPAPSGWRGPDGRLAPALDLDSPLYLYSMQRDAATEAVFKPVRPPTTFEETVERLGTAIRLGLLPAGQPAAGRARPRRPARDLALDASRGADHAGAERPPRRAAGPHRGHVRRRAAAAGGEGRTSPSATTPGRCSTTGSPIETGATILAAERAEPDQLERLDELVAQDGRRERLRGVPARRHPLPHRDRGGGELAPAGQRR